MLKGISKLKGYDGGEIIKFSSYTGFDQRTVLIDGHLNNFSGVIDDINEDKKKLKVMVKIFGRKNLLELSYMQVEKES